MLSCPCKSNVGLLQSVWVISGGFLCHPVMAVRAWSSKEWTWLCHHFDRKPRCRQNRPPLVPFNDAFGDWATLNLPLVSGRCASTSGRFAHKMSGAEAQRTHAFD